ncbi:hypothetical protein ACPCG0_03575 [Propionibacteriaceae bacterium Y1923]
MTTTLTSPSRERSHHTALPSLVRHEIRAYATSPLFLVGVVLLAAVTVTGHLQANGGASVTMDMIAPATLLGVLGMVVMGQLTARSDRTVAAAGGTPAGESQRTLALAAATVVPLAVGLLWFADAMVRLRVSPPAAWAVPFGPLSMTHVAVVIFCLTVVSAVGGPLLGLLVARWLPGRGWAVVAPVVVVLVTIMLQGNFQSTWHWRVVWPWTYWWGPTGWNSGSAEVHWTALPGSPGWWLVYLVALCVLGVLLALAHDRELDRRRVWIAVGVVLVVAVAALVLTMTTGLPEAVVNPVGVPA